MLLGRGAAVDGRMASSAEARSVPLQGASANGHIEVVKTLLAHGAEIDDFAIEAAILYDYWEILQLLVDACDCVPFHLLSLASILAPTRDKVVSLLCSKPIMVEEILISEFTQQLSNLLQRGEISCAKLLLEKGFPEPSGPFEFDLDWPEPLEQEHLELARMLLDRGWVPSDDMVRCVKLSDEKESQRPEKRPRLE